MAGGADLRPTQLVNIEHRYIPVETVLLDVGPLYISWTTKSLQVRRTIRTDTGDYEWSDWTDVPVVEEE